jgi:hypothetical protein
MKQPSTLEDLSVAITPMLARLRSRNYSGEDAIQAMPEVAVSFAMTAEHFVGPHLLRVTTNGEHCLQMSEDIQPKISQCEKVDELIFM